MAGNILCMFVTLSEVFLAIIKIFPTLFFVCVRLIFIECVSDLWWHYAVNRYPKEMRQASKIELPSTVSFWIGQKIEQNECLGIELDITYESIFKMQSDNELFFCSKLWNIFATSSSLTKDTKPFLSFTKEESVAFGANFLRIFSRS
jgi:hypothetical protein